MEPLAIDFAGLFTKLLELSPFVATLFLFLFKVWNSQQKTNEALIATMKEHSITQMAMQKEMITAQNNSADANRMLANSIVDLRTHTQAGYDELTKEINELRFSKANGRTMPRKPVAVISPSATA